MFRFRYHPVKMLFIASIFSVTFGVEFIQCYDIPELKYLNTSVNPCDDFYEFSCGNFKNFHTRPSTQNVLDQFNLLENQLIVVAQEILSKPNIDTDPTSVKKAKTAFKACLNTNLYNSECAPELRTVNEFGGMPLLSISNESTNFSWNDIGDLVGKYGVPLIFLYSVAQKSQDERIIIIGSDTMSNPSLFRPEEIQNYEKILEKSFKDQARQGTSEAPFDIFLRTLCRNLLKAANVEKTDDEISLELDKVASFMRALYQTSQTNVDISPLQNEITLKELQEWTNLQFNGSVNINWIEYLNNIFQLSGSRITERSKIYHTGIGKIYAVLKLVKETDPGVLKNFALLRIFLFQAPDSNYASRKAFENYYTAKNYQLYPRREYCARKIIDIVDTASLSYAVAYSFIRDNYDIHRLEEASALIQNICTIFDSILAHSSWMDLESLTVALEKSRNMLVLLGIPDFAEDKKTLDSFYERLDLHVWDNYGNARKIRAFKQAYQLSQLGNNDRLFWGKSPFTPNAYYNRPHNKIVIPISMLNPVFFSGNSLLDFGRLGSIIAHEITHGFDLNGKDYNQYGVMQSWWTNRTLEEFRKKTACFENQYSQYYIPEINTYINGSYSINENLADNGGIRIAYNAFKALSPNLKTKICGNYTKEQLFFIGYSTMWCSLESNAGLQILSTSSYPPKRFRVIGTLSNLEEFSEAFHCPLGSAMNPEQKCSIW